MRYGKGHAITSSAIKGIALSKDCRGSPTDRRLWKPSAQKRDSSVPYDGYSAITGAWSEHTKWDTFYRVLEHTLGLVLIVTLLIWLLVTLRDAITDIASLAYTMRGRDCLSPERRPPIQLPAEAEAYRSPGGRAAGRRLSGRRLSSIAYPGPASPRRFDDSALPPGLDSYWDHFPPILREEQRNGALQQTRKLYNPAADRPTPEEVYEDFVLEPEQIFKGRVLQGRGSEVTATQESMMIRYRGANAQGYKDAASDAGTMGERRGIVVYPPPGNGRDE